MYRPHLTLAAGNDIRLNWRGQSQEPGAGYAGDALSQRHSAPQLSMQRGHYSVRRSDSAERCLVDALLDRFHERPDAGLPVRLQMYQPGLTTLVVGEQRQLFGTLSVAAGAAPVYLPPAMEIKMSNRRGRAEPLQKRQMSLPAAAGFSSRLGALQGNGDRLGEFCLLAMDPEHSSRELLGALFHLACIQLMLDGMSAAVMQVHTQHIEFYQRLLGFDCIGEIYAGAAGTKRKQDAPLALLHLELAQVAHQVRLLGGSAHRTGRHHRSLYAYFFAPQEEAELLQRIRLQANTAIGREHRLTAASGRSNQQAALTALPLAARMA